MFISRLLIICILAWSCVFAFADTEPKVNLDSDDISEIKTVLIENVLEEQFQAAEGNTYPEGEAPYEPKAMFEPFYGEITNLYTRGLVDPTTYQFFSDEYQNLYTISINDPAYQVQNGLNPDGTPNMESPDPKVFWTQKYQNLLDTFFTRVEANVRSCVGVGVNATTRVCCAGLKRHSYLGTKPNSCKLSGNSCNSQSECCSGACVRKNLNEPGYCISWKACYQPKNIGESCDPINDPICLNSTCENYDKDTTGLNTCRKTGETCDGSSPAGNSECCSGRCGTNNKCLENFRCSNCVGSGATPQNGETCCPGTYLDTQSNKCKTNLMPFVPILQTSIEAIVDFIFPSAMAQENFSRGQEELMERQSARCRTQFRNDSVKMQECMQNVSNQTGGNFQADQTNILSIAEREELDRLRAQCTTEHASGSQAHSNCMQDSVNKAEKCFRDKRGENPDAANCEGVDFSFVDTAGIKNNRFGELTEEELISSKLAPSVKAKTYSNIDKCEFYSYNDNWRDASEMEKNAEVFLRAFEFTFSNKGTQDYWVDKDANYQNIFTRANDVAKRFRENRGKMINKMAEIDRKMSCKCIAIFGPDKFEADRKAYFDQYCEEEKALLATNLDTSVGKDVNSDGESAGVARSSLENIEESEDSNEKKVEEIDKGAAGISHERLLIEWLALRRDAQLERFVDNSELEANLNDLSEFISNTDFEEVWKDEIRDETYLNRHQPPGDTVPLYNWAYKYPKGWVRLVAIALVIAALPVAIFASAIVAGGLAGGGLFMAIVGAAFSGKGTPGVNDIKYVNKKSYSFFKNWDGFTRYYVGPQYDNNSPKSDTRCDIFAKSSACLKSAYSFQMTSMKYLDHLNGKRHYLIDPKLPLYVNPDSISLERMPGLTKTWKQIMNETRNEGVAYLKTTSPGSKRLRGFDDSCYKSNSKSCYNFTSTNFPKRDVFQEALEKKYFIPFRGSFSAVEFTDSMRKQIKDAAVKYALCYSMAPGGAENPNGLGVASDCGIEGMGENDLGFGALFETTAEAEDFAEYALELHYVYSSISKDTEMGYPLLGAETYFALVAYNMKIVGSMAAARTNKYAETYDLYVADWEKRLGEYTSLGEAKDGIKSRNITYSQRFFEIFGEFQFNGLDNISELDQKIANAQTDGKKFSTGELNALTAAKNKAIRTNKDLEKQKNFIAATKNLEGQELTLRNQNNQLAKINKPLSSFGTAKLGGPFGFNKLNKSVAALNKSINKLNRRKFKSAEDTPSANPFTMPKYGFKGSSYNSSGSSNSSEGESSIGTKDQGFSGYQADALINQLNKDESLKRVTGADTLFSIVSKAYKRNYGKVLVRSKNGKLQEAKVPIENSDTGLSKERKEALKNLLDQ